MLRAPIWITSATSATASACSRSVSSVTTGRPVCARAPRRGSRAPAPRPLKRERARPRLERAAAQHRARAGATDSATRSVCSCDSTVHGPAIMQNVSGPIRRPAIVKAVRVRGDNSEEASLYGPVRATIASTPGSVSTPRPRNGVASPMAATSRPPAPGTTRVRHGAGRARDRHDLVDVRRGGVGGHHDHHQGRSSTGYHLPHLRARRASAPEPQGLHRAVRRGGLAPPQGRPASAAGKRDGMWRPSADHERDLAAAHDGVARGSPVMRRPSRRRAAGRSGPTGNASTRVRLSGAPQMSNRSPSVNARRSRRARSRRSRRPRRAQPVAHVGCTPMPAGTVTRRPSAKTSRCARARTRACPSAR